MGHVTSLSIVPLTDSLVLPAPAGMDRIVTGIPPNMRLNHVSWSPNGDRLALTLRSAGGEHDTPRGPHRLYVVDVDTCHARELITMTMPDSPLPKSHQYALNSIFEDYLWLDNDHVVATIIPRSSSPTPPLPPASPPGPKIQDNASGKTSQSRTFPDLLNSKHDEALFEYYGSSEIIKIHVHTGAITILRGDGQPPHASSSSSSSSSSSLLALSSPRLYTSMDASPDGLYLMIEYLTTPYSYELPCGRFPRTMEIWDAEGRLVRRIASLPLADDIPIAFNACRKGVRSIEWRSDAGATLVWAECRDGGDPAVEVNPRDVIFTLDLHAPSTTEGGGGGDVTKSEASSVDAHDVHPMYRTIATSTPRLVATTQLRYGGIRWGDDELALLYESWHKTRTSRTYTFRPGPASAAPLSAAQLPPPRLLFDRNSEDVYSDPGSPMSRRNIYNSSVLMQIKRDKQRFLLLSGMGASPEGYRPFLDLFNIDTQQKEERLWECRPGYYERLGSLVNDVASEEYESISKLKLLLTRETEVVPPQYFFLTFQDAPTPTPSPPPPPTSSPSSSSSPSPSSHYSFNEEQITFFPHPHPDLAEMQKQIIKYKRSDGVDLNATLFVPPGYDKQRDGPLPCILWAYPREFKSKAAAGQMRKSNHSFSSVSWGDAKLFLTRGYAVLDGPAMPIIGEGEEEPNDRFIEQLTSSARAAVDCVVSMGVADPLRMAVGGHSYGAFMTANLLSHAPDLFACGIARSGSYNRTLTPSGFQSEERSIWQAPSTYMAMSPFMHADKVKAPLLLIHGESDSNPGTFPMQSERYYGALKAHGAVSRLVILPYESHGYSARESVMHTLYEMDAWLEKYCKNREVRSKL